MAIMKRISVLLLCLLVSVPAFAQVVDQIRITETGAVGALGRWRIRVNGDVFTIEKNTAVAKDYSTKITPFSFDATGNLTLTGTANSLGTITSGIWNGTAIGDSYLASALAGKTYNGLSLSPLATGFTIAGGATSKTLTVDETVALSAKAPLANPTFTGPVDFSAVNTGFSVQIGNAASNTNLVLGASWDGGAGFGGIVQSREGTGTNTLFLNPYGGNVGVGITPVGARFTISNTGGKTLQLTASGNATTSVNQVEWTALDKTVLANIWTTGSVTTPFRIKSLSSIQFVTGNVGYDNTAPKMTVATNGNVGVGYIAGLDYSLSDVYVPSEKLTVWDGNFSLQNTGTLAGESLTNGALTGAPPAEWSRTNDCALAANAATWTFSAGTASTLSQAAVTLAIAGKGTRRYAFTYTVSGLALTPTANITTAFASATAALTMTAGAHTIYFTSAASPGAFTITSTLTTGQAFTLDTLSLTEIIGGDIFMGGTVYASGMGFSTALITAGGGASIPTFGAQAIGVASGPATQAQNGWRKFIDVDGTSFWVPAWK
jgi:hypothetical protein